jgi:hypothetical protein
LLLNVDMNHLSFDSLDADRFQHIVQSNPNGSQISLIVPNPNAMVRISIDQRNGNVIGSDTQLIQVAGSAYGAPQPRETTAKHQNSALFHPAASDMASQRICRTQIAFQPSRDQDGPRLHQL